MRHARVRLGLLAVALLAAGAGAARQEPAATDRLEIRYLANEGFLIRARGKGAPAAPASEGSGAPAAPGGGVARERAVLIDAFVGKPYQQYAALPEDLLEKLRAAKAPFDAIDLALTSHVHRDHFQADVACAFLGADRDAPLWSTEQVIDAVREHEPELAGAATRLRGFWPEAGKALAAELDGVKVELFPLFHVEGIQNLACLIRFGDTLVLHVGDARLDEGEYAPYELQKRRIDVALLPYWYFQSEQGCADVQRWIGARHYVAMHVPPAEYAELRRAIAGNMPGVVMLEKGGDAKVFELED